MSARHEVNGDSPDAAGEPIRRGRRMALIRDLFTGLLLFAALSLSVELDLVVGSSMDPALKAGNVYVGARANPNLDYGRIVSIEGLPEGVRITKRIIGKAGDEIDLAGGAVFRNGEALDEPYATSPTYATGDITFPVVVPEGTLFVLGDDRRMSRDSRFSEIGMVPERSVRSSYLFLLPWTR